MQCAICGEEIPADATDCPLCDAATLRPGQPPEDAPVAERLAPGSLLAGRYRLLRELGRGGMGEVYLADDERLGQAVALKFLPASRDQDPELRQRLLAEVRFARQVSHPNVCRVYDVGEAGGRLFLTMEHVEGEDLRALLHRGRLPREEAVDVAVRICRGLAAIHAEGILHRDLKPANVMVDAGGGVRLTDFGLASAAGAAADAASSGGTPAYMAPEQFRGGPATAAGDLYALGLVIYELFTGRRAHTKEALHEIARLYRQPEPASPPLPEIDEDDLDPAARHVVHGCLAEEPGDRPASAAAVAARLEGFLEAEREAEERTRQEVVRVRRQRRRLVAAIAVLLVFGVVTSVLAWRIAREAERAEREAETVRQIADFLVGLFEVNSPYAAPEGGRPRGETLTVREILDVGSRKLETSLTDQPVVQARLMNTIGRVDSQLGLYDSAEALFEKALALRRQLGDPHGITESALDLAQLNRLKGETDRAERLLREVLTYRESLEEQQVATTLNELAWLLHFRGEDAEAEVLAREVLDLIRSKEDRSVAATLGLLAFLRQSQGDLDEAESFARQALTLSRVQGGEHPDVAEYVHSLGRILLARKDHVGAEILFRESLDMRQRLLGEEHHAVAQSLHDLACAVADGGDNDEAVLLFQRSLAMYRRLFGDKHPGVAMNLRNMAHTYERAGRPEKAAECRELLAALKN